MNDRTLKRLEALYYERVDKIPDSDECVRARNALRECVKNGEATWEDDALFELESANQKQGFVYGFRAAARMGDLLKEAADV